MPHPAPTHLSDSETTVQGPCRKNEEKLPEVQLRCYHGQMWKQQALFGVTGCTMASWLLLPWKQVGSCSWAW